MAFGLISRGHRCELTSILKDKTPPSATAALGTDFRDLRSLLWSSIDNDTSRDLDQIEWAERLPEKAATYACLSAWPTWMRG